MKMGYLIYLAMFLIAGFVFANIVRKPSDIEIKTQMLKAQLEWMKTPEYKAHQEAMWELEKQKYPIIEPLSLGNSYWTKSTKETKK